MDIIFSESSGLNKSVYGDIQFPIRCFMEKRAEAFERNSQLENLFLMGKSENFADAYTTMTAMGNFMPTPENGNSANNSMEEGYSCQLEYYQWTSQFAISKMMVEDAKLMDMKRQPVQFMTAYMRTREMFGAQLFGAAMSGKKTTKVGTQTFDLTTADGANLFSQTHKPKVSGGNQSNCFSDAFSLDALNRAEEAMQNFRDDNGNISIVAPDTIVIPNDAVLKQAVFAAIGSDKDPVTANNAFNYQYGRWNVIIWPYLNQFISVETMPWILMDSTYNQDIGGAVWNDRVPLSVESYEEHGNHANIWDGRARFNARFVDFRAFAAGGMASGSQLNPAA